MSRADRAKAVLENEEFQGAFKKIENDILNDMKRVERTDTEGIQALTISYQLMQKLTSHFAILLSDNDKKIAQFNARQNKTGNG